MRQSFHIYHCIFSKYTHASIILLFPFFPQKNIPNFFLKNQKIVPIFKPSKNTFKHLEIAQFFDFYNTKCAIHSINTIFSHSTPLVLPEFRRSRLLEIGPLGIELIADGGERRRVPGGGAAVGGAGGGRGVVGPGLWVILSGKMGFLRDFAYNGGGFEAKIDVFEGVYV
jgi:hypothetical protein